MARYIKVDGQTINPNSGFTVSLEDLSGSDSGRNLSGLMDKTLVAQKWTVELSFTNLPDSTISKVLKLAKTNTYVQLTFPNPLLGKDDTQEFYSGTPSITHKATANDVHIWDLKLTFIQR